MRVVPPLTVTPANLTATNVAITETLWTAGTYATGVQRYVGTTLYEVVATPSTADEPTVGAAKAVPTWIAVGSINRFKMFDFSIGQSTSRASPIDVTITPGQIVNTVALFEMTNATSVQVKVTDPIEGIVYNQTRDLADYTGILDWYAYFFTPYNLTSDIVFTDFPAYIAGAVNIILTGGGTVTVGEVVLGRSRQFGSTAIGTSLGIDDFSRKERDDFGNFQIVERRFSKLGSFDVLLGNSEVNSMFRTLSSVRAIPTLYVGGDDFAETIILGFFRDFAILRSGPVTSELSIEIEGLI